jgi:putative PEP-CTERM system TPR-repeat lipoprotein
MMSLRGRVLAVLLAVAVITACSAPTAEEQLNAARGAIAAGEARTASIHLKNLLQRQPNNVTARALLGQVSLALGDAAEAEHNFEIALQLGGDANELRMPLLQAQLNQRKFAQVLSQSESAIEAATAPAERVPLLAMRGAAHRGLGQLTDAEADYRAALALDPKHALSRNELSAVLFQNGQVAEARATLAALLAEQPTYVPGLLLSGSIEAAARNYDVAVKAFEKVLMLEQERPSGVPYVSALLQLTDTQLAQRQVDAAAANAAKLLGLVPNSPDASYLQARIDLERGDLAAAERRLEGLVATHADYWAAYVLLGVVKINQKQMGQAEMYLRRAANGNPHDARARLLLAELYIRRDSVDGARSVIDDSPLANDVLFLAQAGRASLEAGQPALAADYFRRSEQRKPATLRELVDVTSVYVAAGEVERAVRVLQSASLDGPEGQRVANYLLTLVQLRSGNLAAADAAAGSLADPGPETLNLRGAIAARAGNAERGSEFFRQALAAKPDYIPAMLNLARVAVAQHRPDAAAEQLARVLEIDPLQLNAIFGMVQLAADRRDFAEAEVWLARAPESTLRWQLAGDLHFARGKFDDALDDFTRAFALRPTADLALKSYAAAKQAGRAQPEAALVTWAAEHPGDARVNFVLASSAADRGDVDEAQRRYEAVLKVDEKHAAALNNLAWLYSERGDPRALDLAVRANIAKPHDPSILDTLGWLHVRRGEAAEGLVLLQEAVGLKADQPDIGYHLAVALSDSGQVHQASDLLNGLLQRDSRFAERDAAVRLAAKLQADSGR